MATLTAVLTRKGSADQTLRVALGRAEAGGAAVPSAADALLAACAAALSAAPPEFNTITAPRLVKLSATSAVGAAVPVVRTPVASERDDVALFTGDSDSDEGSESDKVAPRMDLDKSQPFSLVAVARDAGAGCVHRNTVGRKGPKTKPLC